MDKSNHSLGPPQNSTEQNDNEIKCIFQEPHENYSKKLNVSEESFSGCSAIGNEEFSSCLSLKEFTKSACVLAMSDKDVKNPLKGRLSKSETDCLNHLNDMIVSASGNDFDCIGKTSDECVAERACYELKSNSSSSGKDVHSVTSYKSHLTTIQSTDSSSETSKTDDVVSIAAVPETIIENLEQNVAAADLNMSVVDDRINPPISDGSLFKINDACGIKTCSQHEMNDTINFNLKEKKSETETETKTETTNKVDKHIVSQDHIERHDSVNDMKAIVCQVLRTWAERQSANEKIHHPQASVSHHKENTQNVTNVREYVKQIEGSIKGKSIRNNSANNKKELYTNILQKVLAEDDNEQVQEVREETLQLMNETENEEQWKQKFHEILRMFQELANTIKTNSHSTNKNSQGKCFNYLNGPREDTSFTFQQSHETLLLPVNTTKMNTQSTANVGIHKVYNKRSVAEQTEVLSQKSFCCQVSLFPLKLEHEVQTDESSISTTTTTITNKDDASDTLIEMPNSMSEHSGPFGDLNTEGSGMSLTKVSGSQMELLSASYKSAPCEHDFHTIHIEAVSSPASSVLQRQPLCTRFWRVVRQFCLATCFCIQVNKDCLFCIGFFLIFVVCSSLLTAFFYRTLHADTHMLQHPLIRFPTVQSLDMKNYRF